MPNPIQALNLADFAAVLNNWTPQRRITTVHIHCTDRPRHADWRGLPSVEGMRRFHQSIGMRDIAQHLTIDPAGILWTGRPFDAIPASVRGYNGTRDAGPFMIEMVGLFENNTDPFRDPQKQAVYGAVVEILKKSGLDEKAVKFHREFPNTGKTCPGMDLDPAAFRRDIAAWLAGKQGPTDITLPAGLGSDLGTRDLLAARADTDDEDQWQVPEDDDALYLQTALGQTAAGESSAAEDDAGARSVFAARSTSSEFRSLIGHAVNTSQGLLSSAGLMRNTPADLERLVLDHLLPAIQSGKIKHIVFHAHGGLVSERAALCYAKTMVPWWMSHGVYPVFFIWESNAMQAIFQQQRALAGRGITDWWDKGVEVATQPMAREIWSRIKANARRCSEAMTASGQPGGLFEFARILLRHRARFENQVQLHAVGHSTGPILLARLMPLLTSQGLRFSSLSYLAPAIRIDDFEDEVQPAINSSIDRLCIYTMNRKAERDDNVIGIYRKSLLYYVRDACEDRTDGRVLGLQEDLLDNPSMVTLFGLTHTKALRNQNPGAHTRIEFSQHRDQAQKNDRTTATEHGAFDNDKATMTAVLADIVQPVIPSLSGGRFFPTDADFRYCRSLDAPAREMDDFAARPPNPAGGCGCCPCCSCGGKKASEPSAFDEGFDGIPVSEAPDAVDETGDEEPVRQTGRRKAVCIGINDYADSPLSGCVSDCENWARKLRGIGFSVRTLTNQRATRTAMRNALRRLIAAARPGDELVYFYAGHGTQIEDLNGDEVDHYDEALVPVDYHRGQLFTDDDIYEECRQLELKGNVTLTIITDCCHSGTNTRARFGRDHTPKGSTNRFMPMKTPVVDAYRESRSGTRGSTPKWNEDDALPGIVAFAACRDREVALESNGRGDFTRHALSIFDTAIQRGDSNQQVLREILRAFGTDRHQNPQLQEPAQSLRKRPFLGGRA
jgi:hypothetical protein